MKKLFCLLFVLLLILSIAFAESADAPLTPDIDLTKKSETVAYAQLVNMLYEPENYLGKVIRMAGYLDLFEDDLTGTVYFSCIVPDSTGCCSEGLEFVWAGEHLYPDDYPEYGAGLTVTGRLESYEDAGWTYLHLVDAEVLWNEE